MIGRDKEPHCCDMLADAVRREGDLRYRRKHYTLEKQGIGINYCPFCGKITPEYAEYLQICGDSESSP